MAILNLLSLALLALSAAANPLPQDKTPEIECRKFCRDGAICKIDLLTGKGVCIPDTPFQCRMACPGNGVCKISLDDGVVCIAPPPPQDGGEGPEFQCRRFCRDGALCKIDLLTGKGVCVPDTPVECRRACPDNGICKISLDDGTVCIARPPSQDDKEDPEFECRKFCRDGALCKIDLLTGKGVCVPDTPAECRRGCPDNGVCKISLDDGTVCIARPQEPTPPPMYGADIDPRVRRGVPGPVDLPF